MDRGRIVTGGRGVKASRKPIISIIETTYSHPRRGISVFRACPSLDRGPAARQSGYPKSFEENGILAWTVVRSAIGLAAAFGFLAGGSGQSQAQAQAQAQLQGRLDARYAVTLGGVPIGKGAWVVDISDNQFTAAASGATSGLLRVLSTGRGSGASRGYLVGSNLVPASFAASITTDKKTEEIRMTLGSGDVKEFVILPPLLPDDERIPVTDAHRRSVTDPMTGSLVRVPGNGNPVGPPACQRTTSVFDGRMRYDLKFAYKRMEQVKAEKGYEGPAVVCS